MSHRARLGSGLAACCLLGLALIPASATAGAELTARSELANECVSLESGGRPVAGMARLYLEPTGLRAYLIEDDQGKLLAASDAGGVERVDAPGPAAEWTIKGRRPPFKVRSAGTGAPLAKGRLGFAGALGCTRYPEARTNAHGRFDPTKGDGSVRGFADIHLHVTANLRAGGAVVYGEPFDPFGIPEALGHDAEVHGPDGSLDVTGNLLRTGEPTGTHDTHGWPTFAGWPVNDTNTHQQAYYMWLKRVWKAGMRLVVAQTVEDEPLCEIEPLRTHSCDEMETIKLEIAQLRALQNYVDAQSGGRGRGWLRIVTDPFMARRAIEHGKLAVVIGMEASDPFGCSEYQGVPQCTREDVDAGLRELRRLGLRSMFIAHWIDNAFGGAAFEEGAKGDFIKTFEVAQTGHPFATEPCAGADEAGGECNSLGLTDLGAYLVRRLIAKHMLIETDHLSQKAREAVFDIAEAEDYPLVSSHTGTGGEWTPEQLERLYRLGGLATVRPGTAPEMAADLRELERSASGAGGTVALGTDTGGFSSLPGPRPDAGTDPLRYPFKSFVCDVRFARQRTGRRTFDLNADGVAHYGLFADLIADIEQQPHGRAALRPFFGSVEAYLEMWEGAYRRD
jgi:microsomal dipeptidase-like Zn-dependent dipeptidase